MKYIKKYTFLNNRPSRLNRAAASFRRSRRSFGRKKRDSSGGGDRRGSDDGTRYHRKPNPPPVGFNCVNKDASSSEQHQIVYFQRIKEYRLLL